MEFSKNNYIHQGAQADAVKDFGIFDARQDHLQQVVDIYNYYILHSTATFHLEAETLSEYTEIWRDIVIDQRLPFLVATDLRPSAEGKVLGFAYARPFHPRPAYSATVELAIYVDKSGIGRRLGRALLRALLEKLKGGAANEQRPQGIRQVIALFAIDDRHPMDLRKFYASEGFVEAGILKKVGFKFGEWLDVCYAQKSLVSESSSEN